jgi:homoserine O-acetyltransferase/O-succinyltransferase
MSDPIDARIGPQARPRFDPPDSPTSVGWTRALRVRLADEANPLALACGRELWPVDVEYETYGELSPARDNAVLVCPALSGGAHCAGWMSDADELGRPWEKGRPGWWDEFVGPGKAIDTTRFFVVCASLLGGCYGTTGPSSIDPATGEPYGLRFPVVTIGDWVELEARLLDHLGLDGLLAAMGGSLGGQQAMEWGIRYPGRVGGAAVLAAAPALPPMGLALNVVAREAIRNDPSFAGGAYYGGSRPNAGLGAARMLGHISYLSAASLERKFGRGLQAGDRLGYGFEPEFQVESYLAHQAGAFAERFDANSYLYITRAMDYYNAADWGDGDLTAAARRATCRWLVMSFVSDWLYPVEDCSAWPNALEAIGGAGRNVVVPSTYGHDSFLLEVEAVSGEIRGFLSSLAG